MLKGTAFFSVLALLLSNVEALDNGLLTKPWLGFNTYNAVSCSPSDAFVRSSADALASQGYVAAGYQFLQLDCGYQATSRNSSGFLTHNTARFPNGIKAVADHARSKGLKWAMYSDAGVKSCDTTNTPPPGSLGNEKIDAQYFLENGAELLKYDNCYVTANNNAPKDADGSFLTRYSAMQNAITSLGAGNKLPMTTCQWGVPFPTANGLEGPDDWTPSVANGYRLSDDIAAGWTSILQIYNQAINICLNGKTKSGSWADADMLQVGNNVLSSAEEESHFAYWAMIKSPLMISTNLTSATSHTKSTLQNAKLLAINQDAAGKPVTLAQRWSNDRDLFSGPLSNGDVAVLLVDHSNKQSTKKIDFVKELGISSANYEDLYTGAKGTGVSSFSKTVAAHGPIALRLSNVKKVTSTPSIKYLEAESATLSGGASVANCSGCSNGKKVGNLDGSSSITFNNVVPTSTSATLLIDYLNCEVQFSFAGQTNVRGGKVSVNGGASQQILFPLTGYNWDKDVLKNFKLELTGLKVGQANTIKFEADSSVSQYAPDFDRVGLMA